MRRIFHQCHDCANNRLIYTMQASRRVFNLAPCNVLINSAANTFWNERMLLVTVVLSTIYAGHPDEYRDHPRACSCTCKTNFTFGEKFANFNELYNECERTEQLCPRVTVNNRPMFVYNFQDKTKQKHLSLNNFLVKTQILPIFHEVSMHQILHILMAQ